MAKRIRDYGIIIGKLNPGENNLITDVKGVQVGHYTLNQGDVKTGVTAVLPHQGDLFHEKVMAASYVINGFGKTTGLIQLDELGTIETPILLTNTLSVGLVYDALVEYMLEKNEDIGVTTGTVNPIVCECNDSYLNDIRGRHVKKEHVFEAIKNAEEVFEEGAVGAGTGMSCYQLKGGIGSSSRRVLIKEEEYTVGALVLSNFGLKADFILNGVKAGEHIAAEDERREMEKGSVIIVIATDLPLTERQLKRAAKRAAVGLTRTGSYIGNGSGDIVLAFSTANKVKHYEDEGIQNIKALHENHMDQAFRAAAEATEEAILNSLICAEHTQGRAGHIRESLKSYINQLL